MSLRLLYGIDTGIHLEELYSLSKLVQKLAGFTLPPNRPIVGDMLYDIESGIVTMFHRRCRKVEPLEYVPFAADLIGRPGVKIALGKGSGLANVEEYLEKRGRTVTPEQGDAIVARIKKLAIEKKALLTDAEFDGILDAVLKG